MCMRYCAGFIVALDVDETFLDGGVAFAYASSQAKRHFIQQCSTPVVLNLWVITPKGVI